MGPNSIEMANITLDTYLFLLYFKGKNILSLRKHSTIWKHGTDVKSYVKVRFKGTIRNSNYVCPTETTMLHPCPRDYFHYATKMLLCNY